MFDGAPKRLYVVRQFVALECHYLKAFRTQDECKHRIVLIVVLNEGLIRGNQVSDLLSDTDDTVTSDESSGASC